MRKKHIKDLDGNKKVSTFAPAFKREGADENKATIELVIAWNKEKKKNNFFLKSFGESKNCITFAVRFA